MQYTVHALHLMSLLLQQVGGSKCAAGSCRDTLCAAAGLDEGPASDGGDAMDHAAEDDSCMHAGGPSCDPDPVPGSAVEARRTPAPAVVMAEEPDLVPASAEPAGLPVHAPAPQVCVGDVTPCLTTSNNLRQAGDAWGRHRLWPSRCPAAGNVMQLILWKEHVLRREMLAAPMHASLTGMQAVPAAGSAAV